MTKEEVFQVVKDSIIEFLPDVSPEQIEISLSLKDLGANSVDRMDIVINSMESLGIKIPLVEFGKVNNIQGLVDLLYERAAI
jgi:polyketide biosynthesis acyl carrier protein